MPKLVVLKLGEGSFEQGFPVTLQISEEGDRPFSEVTGRLPAAPQIPQCYHQWQSAYGHLGLRLFGIGARMRLEAPAGQITNVAITKDCDAIGQELGDRLNHWLQSESFRPIREKWLEQLLPTDVIRVILQTQDPQLQHLPWHLWDLIDRYPHSEVALGLPAYERVPHPPISKPKIKILAILGSSEGIDVQADRALLEQLPNAEVCFLVEPQRRELTDRLWAQAWDILFFAGHSSSQELGGRGDRGTGRWGDGEIAINAADRLTIQQLRYALKKAVERGLKLAIFNSCDGLGLARNLADLQIPQMIVMREPVPDRVAQDFLKSFLTAFSSGEPLYLAVREAREKLQGLEDQFPCATWLPVICQNPAEIPLTWEELVVGCRVSGVGYQVSGVQDRVLGIRGQIPPALMPLLPNQVVPAFLASPSALRPLPSASPRRAFAATLLISLGIAACVSGVRFLGWLQPLELIIFDQMIRSRPTETVDDRLMIIGITEEDISTQERGQGSISDATLDRLLKKLTPYQPRVIGLDIYRDFPANPAQTSLVQQLQQNHQLVAICKVNDPENNFPGIAPPPEVPNERLGFSDFWEDSDGVLRRQVLFITPDPASPCPAPYAFSTQIAFRYLLAEGIEPSFTPEGNLQLGNTVFPRLRSRTGGYQGINAQGNQILLNYRHRTVAPQVTLTQVLSGDVNLDAIRDGVVLIGVTADSSGDIWSTPYGTRAIDRMSGVEVQAQMISQLLSAVLDQRPLIWVWTQAGELLWISSWALIGGVLVWSIRSQRGNLKQIVKGGILIILTSGVLYAICYVSLTQGGWIPLVPAVLALVLSSGAIGLYKF